MALVQLAEVSKVYRSLRGSDYEAVRDFSLDIEPGEFFCLLGTSGCGKTTVLNMVAGFERCQRRRHPDRRHGRSTGRAPTAAWSSRATIRSTAGSRRSATSSSACACAASHAPSASRRRGTISSWSASSGQEHKHPYRALRRHEAAHPDRPRAGQRAADAADGRAVRRARCPHPRRHAARAAEHLRARPARRCCSSPTTSTRRSSSPTKIGVMHAGPASKLKGVDRRSTLTEAERDRTHDRFVAVYRQVHEMIRDEVAISLQRTH